MSFFSESIKKLRIANGYTQKEVCEATGISQGNYSGLENGKIDPSLSALMRLSSFYDEFIDTLVSGRVCAPASSREEMIWYHRYRKLSPRDQLEIDTLIEMKLKNNPNDDSDIYSSVHNCDDED